jgi:hypothetical protein
MATERGREIMEVVRAEMPGADVAFAHGPYVSAPSGPRAPEAIGLQVGSWQDQELSGAFFTGFAEALGPGMRLIDGGELYALRSASEFRDSFAYRDGPLAGRLPWEVDEAVLRNWSDLIDQGHMIYTDEFPAGYVQTPDSFVRTFVNAHAHSEGALFVYTDHQQFEWLVAGQVPREWEAALIKAMALVRHRETGSPEADALTGRARPDLLIGRDGDDAIDGRRGQDWLIGGRGADLIDGGRGADCLQGGSGTDRLDGGAGADRLQGGRGADVFVLRPGGARDQVIGFDPAMDRIDVPEGAEPRIRETAAGLVVELGTATLVLRGLNVQDEGSLVFL